MIEVNEKEFLWVEKYRPQTIKDCILPSSLTEIFQSYVDKKEIPHMLLAGGAGIGKTTVAKALCNEVGADWMIINASNENGIDTLRNKVTNFASTVSFSGNRKVCILDEADHLSPMFQAALRNFAEEFSKNFSMIMTCNYRNKIIEPLQSRFTPIEFRIPSSEKPKLATGFMKRIEQILKNEEIPYSKKVVAELISKYFPDFRRILNELQKYSSVGSIDDGILVNFGEESLQVLIKALKEKKFNDVRKWVAHHADNDSAKLFADLYEKAAPLMQNESIPDLILILAQYQYQAAFAANQEINNMACLTEIMMRCSWR
jgi:replication factor C small subunit